MDTQAQIEAPALALGTFESGGAAFPGLVLGDSVLDVRTVLGGQITVTAMLADWDKNLAALRALAGHGFEAQHQLAHLRPCVPFQPRQILCAGANYHKHVVEMAGAGIARANPDLPADKVRAIAEREADDMAAGEPFLFAGVPGALCGSEDNIILWGGDREHDWELELAVVIGRGGRDIPLSQAMDHVAGYTIVNDITTRDMTDRSPMPYTDLLRAKSRPTFFPVGPYIVPRENVPDHEALRVRLSVNGQAMQDDSTADLIHGVDRLISYASSLCGLYAGDLLLTGSPSGNAAHHGNRWLRPGDVIESEIEGLGKQRNVCVADLNPSPRSTQS